MGDQGRGRLGVRWISRHFRCFHRNKEAKHNASARGRIRIPESPVGVILARKDFTVRDMLGTEAINDVVPIKVMDFLFAKQMCLR